MTNRIRLKVYNTLTNKKIVTAREGQHVTNFPKCFSYQDKQHCSNHVVNIYKQNERTIFTIDSIKSLANFQTTRNFMNL